MNKRIIAIILLILMSFVMLFLLLITGIEVKTVTNYKMDDTGITDVSIKKIVNGAKEEYPVIYTNDSISINAFLPNDDSKIIYNVAFTNKNDRPIIINHIQAAINGNNIDYKIQGIGDNETIKANKTVNFTITIFHNDIPNELEVSNYIALQINIGWVVTE